MTIEAPEQGIGMDDEYKIPLREIVRDARTIKRPDMVVSKMDVLARKGDMSVTFTFAATRDMNRREAARWLSDFCAELEDAGYETKEQPRTATHGAQRTGKTAPKQHTKSDGTLLFCPCGKRVLDYQSGSAGCEDFKNKGYAGRHTFISAKDMGK